MAAREDNHDGGRNPHDRQKKSCNIRPVEIPTPVYKKVRSYQLSGKRVQTSRSFFRIVKGEGWRDVGCILASIVADAFKHTGKSCVLKFNSTA